MKNIGWIGTGKMGQRMSKRLIDAGYQLFVYDKIKSNTEPVVKAGATYLDSPAEVAEKTEIIFTMIPNSQILKDIISAEDGLNKTIKQGSIVVDMSTLDPMGSLEAAKMLADKDVELLRSPVTGSIEYAEKGELGVLSSGNKVAYEKVLPLLRCLGNRYHYLGGEEESRYIKIAVNMMVGNIGQMLAESLVLGRSVGLDWDTMIDVIADSAAASPIIKFKVDALKNRDFSPMGSMTIMEKDMDIALNIAQDKKVALPMTALSKQYYTAMIASGRENLDYSAIILLNEEINGMNDPK